jgi:lipopolysaccharide export system protein LptA
MPGIRLVGNVILKHDSTLIYCDSVYLFEQTNRIQAFGRVRVEMSDSVSLNCRRLFYDGNTRVAQAKRNILLTDGKTKLTTQFINYYRNESYGEYQKGGKLINGDDTLTSQKGYYYPQEKMAYFKKNVVLRNPEYLLETDTLGYDTEKKIAIFQAYTRIENEEGVLETSEGNYNTETNKIVLYKGNQIENEDYTIQGDKLDYDNETKLGYAYGHVVIEPKDSSLRIEGNYGEFDREKQESFVADTAVAVQYFKDDTLYVTADTLYSFQDSSDNRTFRAYHHVFFFMNDLQGRADSMEYLFSDSLIILTGKPILWADSSQISADTIWIYMSDNQADSMSMSKNCFVVSLADSSGFNQIKGRDMEAQFIDNKMHRLLVSGNSESIYFAKDDETNSYLAMSKSSSEKLEILFEDNEVIKVKNIKGVQAKLDPYWKIMFDANKLDGMIWRGDERPQKPESPKAFAVRYAQPIAMAVPEEAIEEIEPEEEK